LATFAPTDVIHPNNLKRICPMADKAKCELVLIVDANGDYAVGKDFDGAKEQYENDVGELSACEGGFRVVRVTVGVPLPEVVELTGDAPPWSGAATLAVAG
jgi:hypothetical protein